MFYVLFFFCLFFFFFFLFVLLFFVFFFFFFQAEDGIRDRTVTGVQTCALPICSATAIRPSRNRCKRCCPSGGRQRYWQSRSSRGRSPAAMCTAAWRSKPAS